MGRVIVPKNQKERNALRERSVQEWYSFAKALRYSPKSDAYDLSLNSGIRVVIPREHLPELRDLSKAEAAQVRPSEFGDALRLESKDIAISVVGLVRDVLGFTEAQRRGGSAKTAAKAEASRKNGKSGGRPRKLQPV